MFFENLPYICIQFEVLEVRHSHTCVPCLLSFTMVKGIHIFYVLLSFLGIWGCRSGNAFWSSLVITCVKVAG
jgi:hypothetical protein